MSINRAIALEAVKTMPEDKINAFVTLFFDENDLARLESDLLANDPNAKRYKNFKEFMEEMEQEDV